MKRAVRILIPIFILLGSWFGYQKLSVKPPPKARPAPRERVVQTRVETLLRTDFQITIRTQGLVKAHHQAILMGQVSGRIVEVSENLHDGAFFEKGDVLARIERVDLEAEVIGTEADLARAEAQFSQEEAKAKQARLNWEDLGYDEEPNDLVLRLPQLREAEANVKASQARLDRARRDLERTGITAPFAGRVLTRSISIGQQISPSTPLAEIFSTDFVEVRLPISIADQRYLQLPETTADLPLPITLTDAIDEDATAVWKGEIVGSEGQLDPESRELFTIARIYDPFGLHTNVSTPPLRIGQPLTGFMRGNMLEDVLVIPRTAVTKLDQIYLVDPDTLVLSRHEIEPIWSDEEFLIIRDKSIPNGTYLATSRIPYAPEGTTVEILEEPDLSETVPEIAEEES